MNSSEQFHEHLQAGRLAAAISVVVGQVVELDIITNTTPGSLHTKVNLLTGQIVSTVDQAFVSDKADQKLLEFHTNQIAAVSQIVREQLRGLQDLLQVIATPVSVSTLEPVVAPIIVPEVPEPVTVTAPITVPEIPEPVTVTAPIIVPEVPEPVNVAVPIAVPEIPEPVTVAAPIIAVSEPVESLVQSPEIVASTSAVMPGAEMKTGIASGLAAAVAQAGAPNPLDATAIPNKFDQALKSAGIRQDTEDSHPFVPHNPVDDQSFAPTTPKPLPDRELIDLLSESGDDWDEWLLEEDNILSELSEVGDLMTKDTLANQSGKVGGFGGRPPAEWDEFLPEYDAAAHKNQANVERFRQNLVNDPQLMSELLAELDDIEQSDSERHPKL